MHSVLKPLALVLAAAALAGCVSGGSAGPNTRLLERVTGDDFDGDCRVPGPIDDGDEPC